MGCATGEEPYSLAILLSEYLGTSLSDYNIKIYATDIDEDALTIARRGEYPLERLRRVPSPLKAKYFTGRGSILRINRDIRRLISSAKQHGYRCADLSLQSCGVSQCPNIF